MQRFCWIRKALAAGPEPPRTREANGRVNSILTDVLGEAGKKDLAISRSRNLESAHFSDEVDSY